jgi:1-acylglycerone phosphate reductase
VLLICERIQVRLTNKKQWSKYVNSPVLILRDSLSQILIDADYTVPAVEVELAEVRQTFETNLFAVITMCQTFLPLLIKAKGTIVQIGSVAGVGLRSAQLQLQVIKTNISQIIPYVFGSVYNASKAALHSFSDTLRVELAPFGFV